MSLRTPENLNNIVMTEYTPIITESPRDAEKLSFFGKCVKLWDKYSEFVKKHETIFLIISIALMAFCITSPFVGLGLLLAGFSFTTSITVICSTVPVAFFTTIFGAPTGLFNN